MKRLNYPYLTFPCKPNKTYDTNQITIAFNHFDTQPLLYAIHFHTQTILLNSGTCIILFVSRLKPQYFLIPLNLFHILKPRPHNISSYYQSNSYHKTTIPFALFHNHNTQYQFLLCTKPNRKPFLLSKYRDTTFIEFHFFSAQLHRNHCTPSSS